MRNLREVSGELLRARSSASLLSDLESLRGEREWGRPKEGLGGVRAYEKLEREEVFRCKHTFTSPQLVCAWINLMSSGWKWERSDRGGRS